MEVENELTQIRPQEFRAGINYVRQHVFLRSIAQIKRFVHIIDVDFICVHIFKKSLEEASIIDC